MKKVLSLVTILALLSYFIFNNLFDSYLEKRNITSLHSFLCKLETKIRIENKVMSQITSGPKNWLQKRCFDIFVLPYPQNKKNDIEKKTSLIIKRNIKNKEFKSFNYQNSYDDWKRSHANNFSNKFSNLDIIKKQNVEKLKLVWELDLGVVDPKSKKKKEKY